MTTDNPNTYDDERYTNASNDAITGIAEMWEAGGSLEDIENTIKDALCNVGFDATEISVDIGLRPQ